MKHLDKVLTIAVPAYNAEWCLEKCLSSLVNESVIDEIEVIVVNDGSSDCTGDIALRFVSRYPGSFRLISKENGGHGSAINAAAGEATGKYFKVVDADDWVITENLAPFMDQLRDKDADVVLTHFHTVDMATALRQAFMTRGVPLNEVMTMDAFASGAPAAFQCATFHGITYHTAFYRSAGRPLPEKVYFEDQEYATSPLARAKTILPLDIFLYQYLIGNSAQSVSDANQVKRIADIERVVMDVADCYCRNADMPPGAKKLFVHKFCAIVKSYYVVALIKKPDRKAGRGDVARIRRLLAQKDGRLAAYTNRDYNIVMLMHFLHVSSRMLQRMKRSALLKRVYGTAEKSGSGREHETS